MKLDLKGKIKWVTSQWSKPAKGNYVTIKEMAAYSIGGIEIGRASCRERVYVSV